jgi:hypothetical protein
VNYVLNSSLPKSREYWPADNPFILTLLSSQVTLLETSSEYIPLFDNNFQSLQVFFPGDGKTIYYPSR